jgi:hypothetical protein
MVGKVMNHSEYTTKTSGKCWLIMWQMDHLGMINTYSWDVVDLSSKKTSNYPNKWSQQIIPTTICFFLRMYKIPTKNVSCNLPSTSQPSPQRTRRAQCSALVRVSSGRPAGPWNSCRTGWLRVLGHVHWKYTCYTFRMEKIDREP